MIFTQRLSDFEILNIGTVIFFVCSFLGMIIREFSYHATAWNLMTKMFFSDMMSMLRSNLATQFKLLMFKSSKLQLKFTKTLPDPNGLFFTPSLPVRSNTGTSHFRTPVTSTRNFNTNPSLPDLTDSIHDRFVLKGRICVG